MLIPRCTSSMPCRRRIASLGRSPADARLDEIETELRRADRPGCAGRAITGPRWRASSRRRVAATERPSRNRGAAGVLRRGRGPGLDRFDPRARGDLEPRLGRRVALETDKQIALHERTGGRSPGSRPGPGRTTDLLVRLEPLSDGWGFLLPSPADRLPIAAGPARGQFGLGRSRPRHFRARLAARDHAATSSSACRRRCRP